MEISSVVGHQYFFLLPVGLVIVCAGLVFAFGFRSNVEPPNFERLSMLSDDKKSHKKKKAKEKRTTSAANILSEEDLRAGPRTSKQKQETIKQDKDKDKDKVKKVEDRRVDDKKETSKKPGDKRASSSKSSEKYEKPSDYDEGEWETAFSRKDKKQRKREDENGVPSSPEKTGKKKGGNKEDKLISPSRQKSAQVLNRLDEDDRKKSRADLPSKRSRTKVKKV